MLTSLTTFIKNVMKAKVESISAIESVFLVLFTAKINRYISLVIAAVLSAASAICKFAERQEQERGYLNG